MYVSCIRSMCHHGPVGLDRVDVSAYKGKYENSLSSLPESLGEDPIDEM